MTVFFDHVDQLPCLIRDDLPASILKIETNRLASPGIGTMRGARVFPRHKAQPFRNLACVLKANIARIVPDAFNEFRALRQWMIPYVISMSEKLTEEVLKYPDSVNSRRNCSARATPLRRRSSHRTRQPVRAGGPTTKAEKRALAEQSRPVPTSTNEASTGGHVSSAPAGIADHPQQARRITKPD